MKSDKQWQQEGDAHTLAEAEAIKKDPNRLKGAAVAASKMSTEMMNKAQGMKKVAAKVITPSKTSPGNSKNISNTNKNPIPKNINAGKKSSSRKK